MAPADASSGRPRYARIGLVAASAILTGTAVLGGAGWLPAGGAPVQAVTRLGTEAPADGAAASLSAAEESPAVSAASASAVEQGGLPEPQELLVPEDSGEGRRVVFDESAQRVWLVKADETVKRTYLVSGSIYDNLDPGSYRVYSRSMRAWGIDDSGTMRYMVRFTTGTSAAIGFHDIPVDDGERVQTRDQLGTPLSVGCIRQARPDAKALWDFAPLGTEVVVVA